MEFLAGSSKTGEAPAIHPGDDQIKAALIPKLVERGLRPACATVVALNGDDS